MGAAGGEKKGGLISTERETERETEILLFRAAAICVWVFFFFFFFFVSGIWPTAIDFLLYLTWRLKFQPV
jgi:hypothetical protein